MTNPLDSTNPHGIKVVANRGPIRDEVKTAFVKGSRQAATRIDALVSPQRNNTERDRALASFMRFYNRRRPHSAAGGQAPISRVH